MGIIR